MKTPLTDIQIYPVIPRNGLVAFTSFVLDNSLFLSSIAIMTRPNGGYRLLYPTKLVGNKNMGIFYPINSDFGKAVEQKVLEKFIQVTGENNAFS